MLICLVLLYLTAPFSIPEPFEIRELIYRAEVHGETGPALARLRELHAASSDPEIREQVARAMAVVKHPSARPLDPASVCEPAGVLVHGNAGHLLVNGSWLEVGDWVGDGWISFIGTHHLELQRMNGSGESISLPVHPEAVEESVGGCLLYSASVGDVLTFVAAREGLSSFVPSEIKGDLTAWFPIEDWLSLLDRICERADISWTRRRDSVVIRPNSRPVDLTTPKIRRIARKNQSLTGFLQNLAESFNMELMLDDGLEDAAIDIQVENQSWDEVLDCLAMMNGFSWVKVSGERDRLIIQRD